MKYTSYLELTDPSKNLKCIWWREEKNFDHIYILFLKKMVTCSSPSSGKDTMTFSCCLYNHRKQNQFVWISWNFFSCIYVTWVSYGEDDGDQVLQGNGTESIAEKFREIQFREKQQLKYVRREALSFSKFIRCCKVMSQELFNSLHFRF